MSANVVEVLNLWFAFNGQTVLEDATFDIPAGDFVAMIGPNGGGKTTLMKLMLGLLKPDRGTVKVFGESPSAVSHRIGYVPQDVHFNKRFPISALDVVLMGMLTPQRRWPRYSRADRVAAHEALDRMGMGPYCDRKIGELSGGQRQRVLIARALVTQPEVLFLDEPTASIDTAGQSEFYRLLKMLNEEMTIVVVSHDILTISTYVKSVACVNKRIHYHNEAELTGEMLETMYACSVEKVCPVELVAHGVPHRVLAEHGDH